MNKIRTLRADEIECRVGQEAKNGESFTLLLYKDARCDMDILDEVFGAENWQRHHSRDNANCTVAVYFEGRGWVEKEDTGTESRTEAEKGLASDSFKRSCVNWGIGRELYSAPQIRVFKRDCSSVTADGKVWDKFFVKEIGYNDRREIDRLVIENDKGKVLFTFGKAKNAEAAPAAEADETYICEECGCRIYGISMKGGEKIPALELAKRSKAAYGKVLCTACAKKLKAEKEK